MKRLFQPFILGLFISLVLISCEKEKDKIKEEIKQEVLSVLPNTLSAKLDGNKIDFSSVGVAKSSSDPVIQIEGQVGSNIFPRLTVSIADTLTNKIYPKTIQSSSVGTPIIEYNVTTDSVLYLVSGQIEIISLDLNDKVFSGSFSGTLQALNNANASISVTEGAFAGKIP